MKRKRSISLICSVMLLASVCGCSADKDIEKRTENEGELSGHKLLIYCGAAMKDPFQEIADNFEEETGCKINVTYSNAGQIQSQINIAEEGDMFIAGSQDEAKPIEQYIAKQTDLVKHTPVLVAEIGNPKGITGLDSLTDEEVVLLIGDVEATPLGKIAKAALSDMGIWEEVTIGATTATAPQLTTAIAQGAGDAAIVWKENCNTEEAQMIETTDLDPYVKSIPAISLTVSADKEALSHFEEYLETEEADEIWIKYGYEVLE